MEKGLCGTGPEAEGEGMNYESFLESKLISDTQSGFVVDPGSLHPKLFPHQRRIIEWACMKGRSAIFADTGTGKTGCEVEWSNQVMRHAKGSVLMLAPLAVAQQTIREARDMWDVDIRYLSMKKPNEVGIFITNYERLHYFSPEDYIAIVCDESSVLKDYSSVYRKQITEFAQSILYRLAATATPAPNDIDEILNHSEFLGVMSGHEALALFFTQDGNSAIKKRLKRHAVKDFYRWMNTWSVALRMPSDLGFSDEGFVLPPLIYHEVVVDIDEPKPGNLFAVEAMTLKERQGARRDSIAERVAAARKVIYGED